MRRRLARSPRRVQEERRPEDDAWNARARLATHADLVRIDSRSAVSNLPSPAGSAGTARVRDRAAATTRTRAASTKRVLVAASRPPAGWRCPAIWTPSGNRLAPRSLVRPRIDAAARCTGWAARHEGRRSPPDPGREVGPGDVPGHAADHHGRGDHQAGRPRRRRPAPSPARSRRKGIVVAEPTGMVPVRGHRSHIDVTAWPGRAGAFLARDRAATRTGR